MVCRALVSHGHDQDPRGLQLFERDPDKRLGVTGNIRIHPFFKTINWSLLEKRKVEPPFKPKVVCHPALLQAWPSLALPLALQPPHTPLFPSSKPAS